MRFIWTNFVKVPWKEFFSWFAGPVATGGFGRPDLGHALGDFERLYPEDALVFVKRRLLVRSSFHPCCRCAMVSWREGERC